MYHPFDPLPAPNVVSCRKRRSRLDGSDRREDHDDLISPPRKRQKTQESEAPLSSSPLPKSSSEKILFGPENIDKIAENDLCLVRLRDDAYQPLGIMRFLSRGEGTSLVMQYLGCYNLDYRVEVSARQKFSNSWYQPSTKQVYYKPGKLHSLHVPVTNVFSKQEILVSDVIAFPFGLRSNFTLPPQIRDLVLATHSKLFPTSL